MMRRGKCDCGAKIRILGRTGVCPECNKAVKMRRGGTRFHYVIGAEAPDMVFVKNELNELEIVPDRPASVKRRRTVKAKTE